jgi:hypothetical protein
MFENGHDLFDFTSIEIMPSAVLDLTFKNGWNEFYQHIKAKKLFQFPILKSMKLEGKFQSIRFLKKTYTSFHQSPLVDWLEAENVRISLHYSTIQLILQIEYMNLPNFKPYI